MNFNKKLAVVTLAATLAVGVATPAAAQRWNGGSQFTQQIDRLEREVRNARITREDMRETLGHVQRLREREYRYGRDGFNRAEINTMRQAIGNVERLLDRKEYSYRVAVENRQAERWGRNDRDADRYGRYDRDDWHR